MGSQVSFRAVSYTQLDVYKRQELYYVDTVEVAEDAELNFWEKLRWSWFFYVKNSAGYPIFS